MTSFTPFLMERWQSVHENHVGINLSESGVEPLSLGELLSDAPEVRDALMSARLGYPQTNGTVALRERVAALYPGAGVDQIEISQRGSEANYLACGTVCAPGDNAVVLLPNYMQVPGVLANCGVEWRPWSLVERDGRWCVDLGALTGLVDERTKMIAICTPNNPTGAILSEDELDAIGRCADQVGAFVLSDEIYRGAELSGRSQSPSMWGRAENVVVTSGLSKAYGLPGLRIGWLAASGDLAEQAWARHDYTSIAPSVVSDLVATAVLSEPRRSRVLHRTRAVLQMQLQTVAAWRQDLGDLVAGPMPEAGAMHWFSYRATVNSSQLCETMRSEDGILVVPGDHFGQDQHLRIGFGHHHGLEQGLATLARRLRGT